MRLPACAAWIPRFRLSRVTSISFCAAGVISRKPAIPLKRGDGPLGTDKLFNQLIQFQSGDTGFYRLPCQLQHLRRNLAGPLHQTQFI